MVDEGGSGSGRRSASDLRLSAHLPERAWVLFCFTAKSGSAGVDEADDSDDAGADSAAVEFGALRLGGRAMTR